MDHLACPCVAAASARHLLATLSAVDGCHLQCHSLCVARKSSGSRTVCPNLSTTVVDGSGTRHMRQSNAIGGRGLPMPVAGNGPRRHRAIVVSASVETPGMSGAQRHDGVSTLPTAESSNRAMLKTGAVDGLPFLAPDMAKMSLVFVGAEAAPWSKVGGLGDVMGALPATLAARGHRVMTISPRYDQYQDAWDTAVTAEVTLGGKAETVRFFHARKHGVDRVFVDHPLFLEKVWGVTGQKIYGERVGTEYPENPVRFAIFCQAALQVPLLLNLAEPAGAPSPYGEDVVFIVNDWHAALVPLYLRSRFCTRGVYTNAKVAMCVHNLAYQGQFFEDTLSYNTLDLPEEFRSAFQQPANRFELKPILKKQLQVEVGLPVHPEVPLFGFMGRLDEQKGSDILAAAILDLMEQHKERGFQFVVLGTGKPQYEKQLQALQARFPGQVRAMTRFSPRLAHLIVAGCDFMVLPSRFEPAGLIQLHAMLYGTVPVVASTGGMLDSVRDGVTGLQMGTFNVKPEVRREDVMKVVEGLKRAMRVFSTHSLFRTMVTAAMSQDLSWKGPARAWEQALLQLRGDVRKEVRETAEVSPGDNVTRNLPAGSLAKETLPARIRVQSHM